MSQKSASNPSGSKIQGRSFPCQNDVKSALPAPRAKYVCGANPLPVPDFTTKGANPSATGGAGGRGTGAGSRGGGGGIVSDASALLYTIRRQCEYDDPQYIDGCRHVIEYLCDRWKDQEMCDVTLQAAGVDIMAHKVVLASFSDYMEDRFKNYASTDIITIDLKDFSPETVASILHFCYTSELKIDKETVGQLVTCADELGLTIVVKMCLNYFENIDANNAIYFYSIAHNHGLTVQRDIIYDYIIGNILAISESEQFAHLSVERLLEFLSDDCLNIEDELQVFRMAVSWVDFDRENRMKVAPNVLCEGVRMQLISPENLVVEVETVEWLFADPDCHDVYDAAITFHALECSGSRLVDGIQRQPPRKRMNRHNKSDKRNKRR